MPIVNRKTTMNKKPDSPSWIREKIFLGMTLPEYAKANLTLPNAVAAVILAVAIPVMIYRLLYGLGPSTNLSDTNPWGIWIGIDVLCGIALAAGGLVIGTAYHLFGMKDLRRRERFYRGLDRLRERFGFDIAHVGPALRLMENFTTESAGNAEEKL